MASPSSGLIISFLGPWPLGLVFVRAYKTLSKKVKEQLRFYHQNEWIIFSDGMTFYQSWILRKYIGITSMLYIAFSRAFFFGLWKKSWSKQDYDLFGQHFFAIISTTMVLQIIKLSGSIFMTEPIWPCPPNLNPYQALKKACKFCFFSNQLRQSDQNNLA